MAVIPNQLMQYLSHTEKEALGWRRVAKWLSVNFFLFPVKVLSIYCKFQHLRIALLILESFKLRHLYTQKICTQLFLLSANKNTWDWTEVIWEETRRRGLGRMGVLVYEAPNSSWSTWKATPLTQHQFPEWNDQNRRGGKRKCRGMNRHHLLLPTAATHRPPSPPIPASPSACPPSLHPWIFSEVFLFSCCLAASSSSSFVQ